MDGTFAAAMRLIESLRRRDPDLAGLRRAVRAVLIVTPLFAFSDLVVRNPQFTLFTVFGSFALLVMADFGGLRAPRAAAYLSTVLIGAVLLTLGTLTSSIPWAAALATLVVGFCVLFSGVFGGYAAAGQMALMLAFVLAVAVPAPPTAIGDRLAGWALAGAVSTLAGVFLWPRFERVKLHHAAADACRALARLVDAQRRGDGEGEIERRRRDAFDAYAASQSKYKRTPHRPAGPTRRDRAFAELLSDLDRAQEVCVGPLAPGRDGIEEGDGLGRAVVDTLLATAEALDGGPQPAVSALVAARTAHREALDRWTQDAIRTRRSPDGVLDVVDAENVLRMVSYLALALAANAVIATGGSVAADVPLPAGTPVLTGVVGIARRVSRTFIAHLHPSSTVLQGSVRGAVGLALAVLLARVLQLDHGFWVVLGTLTVLRTNAMATGRTTLQALAGTVAGFAIGAALMQAAGTHNVALWALLLACVFLAAYATSAAGFIASQAAFTVYVIVLFNVIAPAGWGVGLLRVEDVAVGAAVSVIVAVLLWPRGARGDLRHAVVGLYRSAALFLAASFDRAIDGRPAAEADRARRVAIRGRERAVEAFDQFLNERGTRTLDPEGAARVLGSARQAIIVGDLLDILAEKGSPVLGCPDTATVLHAEATLAVEGLRHVADRLSEDGAGPATPQSRPSDHALRSATLSCIQKCHSTPNQEISAVAVESISEHIRQIDALTADLDQPVAAAAATASAPWWR